MGSEGSSCPHLPRLHNGAEQLGNLGTEALAVGVDGRQGME